MTTVVPVGSSSDDNLLKPLYKFQVDPSGTLGATDGVAFSNDGSILAATDNLANAYLYRASDAQFLDLSLNHASIAYTGRQNSDGEINAIDFSPDDSMLVTGSNELGAKVWDVSNGELIAHLNDGTNTDGAAFSPNGQWLAAAADGNINIYDVNDDFSLITSLPSTGDEVNSVDWSSDSQFLVSGGDDGEPIGRNSTQLYRSSDWSLVRDYAFPEITKSVRFSPDNQLVALSGRGPEGPDNTVPGVVQVYDTVTGELIADLPHQGNLLPQPNDDQDERVYIESVEWSPDGNYLFTSGLIDGVMRVWSRDNWSLVGWAQAQEPNRSIEVIDISPDNQVAVGGDEGSVYVYQFNPPSTLNGVESLWFLTIG